jgi:two-component system sensor kinase FixL
MVSGRLDFRNLVEDTVALARPDAEIRQIQIIAQVPPQLPAVHGDRVQLQQVLLNLILNGMDAMNATPRPERRLTVRVSEAKDGNLLVAVSDRGTGIASEDIVHIFEPFFTTKASGMGMGLAISRTIVQAHGGEIRAANNALGGATFAFTLPCLDQPNP